MNADRRRLRDRDPQIEKIKANLFICAIILLVVGSFVWLIVALFLGSVERIRNMNTELQHRVVVQQIED
jgi:hypothetical protein